MSYDDLEWPGGSVFAMMALEPAWACGDGGRKAILRGPHGSKVTVELIKTKQGGWTWRWTEEWFGHSTVSEPRRTWWRRELAVQSLAFAAQLYRIAAFAVVVSRW